MMFSVLPISLFFVISCNIFSPDDGEPDEDLNHFTATVNGIPFWGAPQADVTDISGNGDTLLTFSGLHPDSLAPPYLQSLIFSVPTDNSSTSFDPVRRVNEAFGFRIGGFMVEVDGDVIIAQYLAVSSPTNQLTIRRMNPGTEDEYIEGEFDVTYALDPVYESDPPDPNRRLPDSLRVTNGSFRIQVPLLRE